MAGPWEEFQSAPSVGPWTEFAEQAPPAPAEGYDLYRQATDTANRGLTFGLSDKIGAAVLATGHELGLKSPRDVAGPNDSWSEAYRRNLAACARKARPLPKLIRSHRRRPKRPA
jgi:hypothetical protein